jgi:zinc transporter, ZIP family
MIYVSMVEIFVKAKVALVDSLGVVPGNWLTVGGFFGGMLLIASIDKFIPKQSNPHELKTVEDMNQPGTNDGKKPDLLKMGTFTALAIGIHNFPEGIATFTSALQDPALGIAIAVAIAIHNIPEGIAVSVPVYFATGDKKKAFKLSFLSGLSEPIGALVAYLFLMPFLNDIMFGIIFAAVAGIMVFISLDELLPAAKRYDETHLSIYGLIAGMAVMALSLLLFI